MNTELYWTIVVALVSGGWAVTTFFRDRISNSIKQTNTMISRLVEYDKLHLENPGIQKFLSLSAAQKEEYFRDRKRLEEEVFFKAKTLVYKQLNLFDEILSVSLQSSKGWSFLKPAALYELEDWETYIKVKCSHPLYRSILNNEGHIFGASLRDFWNKNKDVISTYAVDPFIW